MSKGRALFVAWTMLSWICFRSRPERCGVYYHKGSERLTSVLVQGRSPLNGPASYSRIA